MIPRRSSGSTRTDSGVEPTRSQNMTVSCRRSASPKMADGTAAAAAGDAPPPKEAIASSSLRRSPTAATPISFRSSAVSFGSTSHPIAFSAKAGAYCPRPRPWSHPAMSTASPRFRLPPAPSISHHQSTGKGASAAMSDAIEGRSNRRLTKVRNGSRLWENAWDEAADALCFPARQLGCRIDRLTRAAGPRRSGPDRRHQWSHTEDRYHSLQIIGQDVKAHLGSDLVQGPGQEVGGAHPSLEGSERVFDGLSSHAHGVGHAVEPGLHVVEHILILPALDDPPLGRRALRSERTSEAGAQVAVAVEIFCVISAAMDLGEFCARRASVVVVLGIVEEVLPGEEAAFGPARRQGLGHDRHHARAFARQNLVAAEVAAVG